MYKFFVEAGLVLFSAFASNNLPFFFFFYFVIFDRFVSFGTVPPGFILVFCLMSLLSIYTDGKIYQHRVGLVI